MADKVTSPVDLREELSRDVKNLEILSPDALPKAAMGIVSRAMAHAMSLGVELEALRGALGVTADDRAAVEAWTALKRVVDNCGGDGEPVGGVDLSIRWNDDLQRYEIGGSAGECTFGADAPTLEVAVVAVSMADEGEHHSVSADGHLLCRECDGLGMTLVMAEPHRAACEECDGTGRRETASTRQGWPKGGLKVPT